MWVRLRKSNYSESSKRPSGTKDWFACDRRISIAGYLKIKVQVADSAINVNSDLIVGGATRLLDGTKPAYWDPYFTGLDFAGFGEYNRREKTTY